MCSEQYETATPQLSLAGIEPGQRSRLERSIFLKKVPIRSAQVEMGSTVCLHELRMGLSFKLNLFLLFFIVLATLKMVGLVDKSDVGLKKRTAS